MSSTNSAFSRFLSQTLFEAQGSAFHEDLAQAVGRAAARFAEHNGGGAPDRVVVYRDGVPGSHFAGIQKEVEAVKAALAEAFPDKVS